MNTSKKFHNPKADAIYAQVVQEARDSCGTWRLSTISEITDSEIFEKNEDIILLAGLLIDLMKSMTRDAKVVFKLAQLCSCIRSKYRFLTAEYKARQEDLNAIIKHVEQEGIGSVAKTILISLTSVPKPVQAGKRSSGIISCSVPIKPMSRKAINQNNL